MTGSVTRHYAVVVDAVIYIRWSSSEQGKGSSLERQSSDCLRHAQAKGWNVVDRIVDDGVSAFKGRNTSEGRLPEFIADVEAGRYPAGVVLLVERLDRLSRQQAKTVFSWLLRITDLGVVVCTVDGDRRYDAGNLDMAAIIEVVVKAALSNEESAKKSERVGAAWAAKRGRLQRGDLAVMTRRAPAWLAVEGAPAAFVVVEERATIVRRIFESTAAGLGKQFIARQLNLDGVPTFGRAVGWHASYIQKILRSPAVIGEFQPGRKPRGEERTVVGDPIPGYFPAVIDADLHARALASMTVGARGALGRGRRLANLFGGRAKCECGARMTFRGKGLKIRANGDLVHEDYLICDAYQRGLGCRNATHYNYAVTERCVLDAVLAQAVDDRHFEAPAEARRVEIEIATRTRTLATLRARAENAMELAMETKRAEPRQAYARLMDEADAEEVALTTLREELVVARGAVPPGEHARRIEALRGSMASDDGDERFAARVKIMGALHDLVKAMVFSRRSRLIGIELADDAFVVVHPFGKGVAAGYLANRD